MGWLPRHRLLAARRTSTFRAATCGRSTATFPICTQSSASACRPAASSTARSSSPRRAASTSTRCSCGCIRRPRGWRSWRSETPAGFVAFRPARRRRTSISARSPRASAGAALEALLARVAPPIYLTPMTRDRALAAEWLDRFEGAGLDGVIAKPADGIYQPGKRAMIKIKHARTADCVVAGFRWHKSGEGIVGSLLLGLYDDDGQAASRRRDLGVHDGRAQRARDAPRAAARERARRSPVARVGGRERPRRLTRMPGGQSRWSAGQGPVVGAAADRARVRGQVRSPAGRSLPPRRGVPALARPTSSRRDCRYDQLEVTTPYELEKVFGAARHRG